MVVGWFFLVVSWLVVGRLLVDSQSVVCLLFCSHQALVAGLLGGPFSVSVCPLFCQAFVGGLFGGGKAVIWLSLGSRQVFVCLWEVICLSGGHQANELTLACSRCG